MSNQALIRLDWQAQQASMTEAAAALKNYALELAALIGKVNDASTQEAAVAAQKELAEIKTQAEKARKAAKAPALEFGRRIDQAHETFMADIEDELLRITRLIGDFQQLEQAKARAAEQARIAEERRIQEERRQAELAAIRAAEAERAKLEAAEREIARQSSEATSKRAKELLAQQQAEIDRQRALAEAKSHEELDRINAQASQAAAALADKPKYEPVRATGQRVVEDWDITVSDIWALARAHPACVTITPRLSEIKGLLKAGVEKIPGVVARPTVKAGVTRGRQIAAIEV